MLRIGIENPKKVNRCVVWVQTKCTPGLIGVLMMTCDGGVGVGVIVGVGVGIFVGTRDGVVGTGVCVGISVGATVGVGVAVGI